MRSMSMPRLASVVAVLLTACAGWESNPESAPPPPAEAPVPSHVSPDAAPPTAPLPEPPHVEIKVGIASVQLLEDCPDPAPAAAQAQGVAAPAKPTEARGKMAEGESFRRMCAQSTVQLALRSDLTGPFRVEAVRVLDAKSLRPAGTSTLRAPTRWSEADGTYAPWDARVDVKTEQKISYKLGELDLSRASELIGPDFNTFAGPFVLELEVSVDGHRQTVRSPEFTREPPHVMVT